jgi:mevalonate kinase
MVSGSGCGKIILFGEHAVVYGRPALAVPLRELRARARVETTNTHGIIIHALDLNRDVALDVASEQNALASIVRDTLAKISAPLTNGLELWVESDIPIGSHLGSSAAISTAIVRALDAFCDSHLSAAEISALVFETEKLYHGTPSGIDNTVIAYEQPIRFTRANGAQPIRIARPFTLVIANTGVASPTKIAVGDVRRAWEQEPARYEKIFDAIAQVVDDAQGVLERGDVDALGELMTRNQELLRDLGVSSPEIETLLRTGLDAGAAGGKLSGGGRGGNVIFYVDGERAGKISTALRAVSATDVIVTVVR